MEVRSRSWWQYIREHRVVVVTILALVIVIVALIIIGYRIDLTGFKDYYQETIATTTKGPSAGTVVKTEVLQPNKTLWDWLQLLIIPGVLVIIGLLFNSEQKRREDKTTTDNQREATLKEYIDKISELLLKEHLGERTADGTLKPEYEHVCKIARVRTITVLTQLDARRISYIFAFLREAGLMSATSNDNVVSLKDADLHSVNWSQADLSGANLSGVNLSGANLMGVDFMSAYLSGANLLEANLSGADFYLADLSNAYLSGADLSGTYLHKADLTRANLGEIFYGGAFFSEARHINSANLSKANLSEANLSGTNLKGVDLRGANLKNAFAVGNGEIKRQAKSLKGATMPDGSIHP